MTDNENMQGESKAKPIEFDLPPDYSPPETDDPNGEFDVVFRLRPKVERRVCVVKIGETDVPLPSEKKPEKAPTYEAPAKRAVAMMDEGAQAGGMNY